MKCHLNPSNQVIETELWLLERSLSVATDHSTVRNISYWLGLKATPQSGFSSYHVVIGAR